MTAIATPPPPTSPPAAEPSTPQPAPSPSPSRSLLPTRGQWVDIAALGALVVLAISSMGNAYGGTRYLTAGFIGTVLGLVIAHVCARTRQPLIVVAAATVVAFFLFGAAVAVPDKALGGIVPTLGTTSALLDAVVQGWVRLLTTLPPVGASADLLTLPFFCGLLAALLALTVAERTRRPLWAVVFPTVVLVVGILFGTEEPSSLLLQGAVYGVLLVGWASVRTQRDRRVDVGSRASRRWVGSLTMVVIAAVVALLLGQHVPGAGAHQRTVLRDDSDPPELQQYPSPLNGFRRYEEPAPGLRDEVLLEVDGLADGEPVRLATMDAYDGVAYSVGSASPSSGSFQRIGEEVRSTSDAPARTVRVTVRGYTGVWVPTVGELVSIRFGGPRADDLQQQYLHNLTTGTGVADLGLRAGDSYTLKYRSGPTAPVVTGSPDGDRVAVPEVRAVAPVVARAQVYADGKQRPDQIVDAIVAKLKETGYFSDGTDEKRPSRPGHGTKRLAEMADPDRIPPIGDGEQYAATAALMAVARGVPARVVMGFEPQRGAAGAAWPVRGSDVRAWIEYFDGNRWVAKRDLTPDPNRPPPPVVESQVPQSSSATPPPPPTTIPPSDDTEVDSGRGGDDDGCKGKAASAAGCPGEGGSWIVTALKAAGFASLPFLAVGAVTGAIGGLKLRRRKRRRRDGPPVRRIAGGWREVTDLAEDLGRPVPQLATRQEAAAMIANPVAVDLARHADANIFGPGIPDEAHVETYWEHVDRTRHAMVAELTAFERWRALVNLSSLRSSGRRRLSRVGDRLPTRRPAFDPTVPRAVADA